MDYADSNKRLKSSSGAPISTGAAGLPVYQPPPSLPASANRPRPSASTTHGATSLRLTVKAPPSKLRQATSGSAIPPNPYAEQSESDDTPAPPVRSARATRNPKVVVEEETDEEEDEEEEEEEEEDAEGEEDEDMIDVHPPPPVIKAAGKGKVTVMPPNEGPLKSVEDKEMDDDEDEEEELSELDSEGDEIGNDIEEDEDEDAEGTDDDDEDGSRSVTPDLTKLTKRQRGAFEEDPALMALSNEALKKKVLSAEEHVQRRAEMARRRKNLSEKRNEEEKMETINKLLQKQAPKRRTRAEINAANAAAEEAEEQDEEGNVKINPLFVKYVQRREGSLLGVPQEWLAGPIGEVFLGGGRGMVEEVA